jgi:hypothetical protein
MVEHLDVEPGQSWEIFRFEPKDAEGVACLFRTVYGEGYPIRTYVEPDLLIRENAAMRVISSVARTPRGDIVGHAAIYNSAPNPRVYESGATLIHPLYRLKMGLYLRLQSHGLQLAETLPEVDVVFGELVCNHTVTQKMAEKQRAVFTALEADLIARRGLRNGKVGHRPGGDTALLHHFPSVTAAGFLSGSLFERGYHLFLWGPGHWAAYGGP